ncbi:MAG: PDZ domain-containing protein [Anaerolineaceae bacterium]|nr:PDZ domain-containing protein [Anaerolineaceae bacterium]
MITRKFVYGGVISVIVAGSVLGVSAQSNTPTTQPGGLTGGINQLAKRFEGVFAQVGEIVQAQATPQPTAQAAAKPTTAPAVQPTVAPTAVPQSPYVGVRVEDTAKGISVRDVIAGSPAASAGLQVDDLIQKANGTSVKNVMEFAQAVLKMKPDDTLKLEIMRADKAQTLTVKVGGEDMKKAFMMPAAMPYDGMSYDSTNKMWQVFNISDHSLLYSAGLRSGDQITGFDGKMVAPADFQAYRDGLKADTNIKLTVKRAGKDNAITVPGAAFKTLDDFNYTVSGLLIDVLPSGNATGPNLDSLSHVTPVNAIAYDGKNWQVYSMVDGSNLQKSGLQVNDQITQFNGKAYDPQTMREWLAKTADTDSIKLTVERAGKTQQISLPAADLTALYMIGDKTSALFFGMPENSYKPTFGLEAITLTDAIAKDHKLKLTAGALVTSLQPQSAAAASGIQMNDVITAVGSKKIDAQNDFNSLIGTFKPGDQITLDVARGDKTMQLKATLPQQDVTGELPLLIQPL